MERETISVIIPALNESETISQTLASIPRDQTHEIIVVDGGSIDGTPEMAASFGVRVLRSKPGRALGN